MASEGCALQHTHTNLLKTSCVSLETALVLRGEERRGDERRGEKRGEGMRGEGRKEEKGEERRRMQCTSCSC